MQRNSKFLCKLDACDIGMIIQLFSNPSMYIIFPHITPSLIDY